MIVANPEGELLLVLSPQPKSNASHVLIQKSNLLQKVIEDEVAGVLFLLLKI